VTDWLTGEIDHAHTLLQTSELALESMRVSASFNSVAHDAEPMAITPSG
jgi:hypothetical protein